MVNYQIINNIDKKKWSDFVFYHPNGNIFQTPELFEVYKKTKKYEPLYVGIINGNDEIIGVLVAVIQKENYGILGKFSSRSIIDGGPLIKDNDSNVLKIILLEYKKIINGKVIYSLFRNYWKWGDNIEVFTKCGFNFEPQLDILIDLKKPMDVLLKNINKNKRRNVIKSTNKGVVFQEITNINDFNESLKLIKETYSRVKVPLPDKSLFINAFKILDKKFMLKTFTANFNGKIIGVRIEFLYKDLIFDWYAGSDYTANNKYPNDFLIYNLLKWGNENGYKVFDFGGAGKPNIAYGVREHKMKFGGEIVEFGRFQCVHNKTLMKIGVYMYSFYKILKKYGF